MDNQERKTKDESPLLTIVPCARCGQSCMIRSPYEPGVNHGYAELRPARTARGLCAECAAHWFLFSVDGIRWALEESGPGLLRFSGVQAEFSRVLGMMHPELGRVDWQRLIGQWNLPWPDDWALPIDRSEAHLATVKTP